MDEHDEATQGEHSAADEAPEDPAVEDAAGAGEEGNEGWQGPAEDLEEDPAYSPDDDDLEGIKGA